jgi:hypothetical protein
MVTGRTAAPQAIKPALPSICLTPDSVLCQVKTSFNRKTLPASSSHEKNMRKAKELAGHDFRTRPSEFHHLVGRFQDVQRLRLEPSVATA